MTSGQWDLNALEALEREALEVVGVLEVPEHVRRCQPASPTVSGGSSVHHSHQHHSHRHAKHISHHQQQHQTPHHPTLSRHLHRGGIGAGASVSHGGSMDGGSSVGCLGRGGTADEDGMHIELKDHIKHCSCTCNHMGYGNFMDYQVRAIVFVCVCFFSHQIRIN